MGKINIYGNKESNQFSPCWSNYITRGPFYNKWNGYYRNTSNLTREQFKLSKLHKFMTISSILDWQNVEEINLSYNSSLRLSPLRDCDPKEWECKNCPNVPCNCCSCNVCPFNSNKNTSLTKLKQLKFPKILCIHIVINMSLIILAKIKVFYQLVIDLIIQ